MGWFYRLVAFFPSFCRRQLYRHRYFISQTCCFFSFLCFIVIVVVVVLTYFSLFPLRLFAVVIIIVIDLYRRVASFPSFCCCRRHRHYCCNLSRILLPDIITPLEDSLIRVLVSFVIGITVNMFVSNIMVWNTMKVRHNVIIIIYNIWTPNLIIPLQLFQNDFGITSDIESVTTNALVD